MGEYIINGGSKLFGELEIEGAKNAVLPILASTILIRGECKIRNVPMLRDTETIIEILEYLGCFVKIDGSTMSINSKNVKKFDVPIELMKKMRSSIIFMGALLSIFNKCIISYPGGCNLGKRPIDLHIDNLKKMNISIKNEDELIICETEKIEKAIINLKFPSVGATENLILASVFVNGETIINNPAKEPEIVDFVNFLNKAGAKIKGAGTEKIIIKGVSKLYDVDYCVMPDRIVAGTFLVAGLMTKGELTLKNVNCKDLKNISKIFERAGSNVKYYEKENIIKLIGGKKIKSIDKIITNPHPEIPTDMQSQFMAMLSTADGQSIIKENLFESRDKQMYELNHMGANIKKLEKNEYVINGVEKLTGREVKAEDLRGGASLILAGLIAEGTTIVKNSEYIERGYVKIEEKLKELGASIKFIE